MTQESKPFYKSKRFWTTIVTAVAPWIPYVGPWISNNPEAYSAIIAGIFGGVGAVTTGPMHFKK